MAARRLTAFLSTLFFCWTRFAPLAYAEAPFSGFTMAFGSCLSQSRDQSILDSVASTRPDLFFMLGDNFYPPNPASKADLLAGYEALRENRRLQAILAQTRVLATWDDHDFGINDGGASYQLKQFSQQLFKQFFRHIPGEVRQHDGVYYSALVGRGPSAAQIIALDTRFFRGELRRVRSGIVTRGPYEPALTDEPFLGEQQWAWLKRELSQDVRWRVVISSVQLLSDQHGFESWGNFPQERARLFNMLRARNGGRVVVLSGDRHHAEISRSDDAIEAPLYDITSSAFNLPRSPVTEENRHRVAGPYEQPNFGLLSISPDGSSLRVGIRSERGEELFSVVVPYDASAERQG